MSFVSWEQQHNTAYRSFLAYVQSRYPESGSSNEDMLGRLAEAKLPPHAVDWDFIKNHLIAIGWDDTSIERAHLLHRRYVQKGHMRRKWRKQGVLRALAQPAPADEELPW